MKQLIIIKLFIVILLTAFQLNSLAVEPENNTNTTLFKIGRSKDANEIYYEVKTNANGSLNLEEPIKIYWIKFTKEGAIKPLTRIQDNFAYGIKILNSSSYEADFQFVSYSKRTLKLRICDDGNYRVFTNIDGKEVEVKRVFIQIDGGSFWFPTISRVELHAKIPNGGKSVVEII